jgi:hypothetical protein
VSEQPPSAAALESLLLGAKPTHTRDDVARLTGLQMDTARRLRRALGFANVWNELIFVDSRTEAARVASAP